MVSVPQLRNKFFNIIKDLKGLILIHPLHSHRPPSGGQFVFYDMIHNCLKVCIDPVILPGIIHKSSDIDPVFDYYTPVIIGNNDYMTENPEITKSFLAAVKKGYEYAAEHPDESAQILIDSDNTGSLKGSEQLVKESQTWISTQYIADAESWGVIDAARWNAFYNWLNDNNLVAKKIPEGTGFSNEYLS